MVLGFILYEAVDFVWHFGKMTYNGSKYVYDWYYEIPSADEIEIDKLKLLEEKIVHLEHLLEDKLDEPGEDFTSFHAMTDRLLGKIKGPLTEDKLPSKKLWPILFR